MEAVAEELRRLFPDARAWPASTPTGSAPGPPGKPCWPASLPADRRSWSDRRCWPISPTSPPASLVVLLNPGGDARADRFPGLGQALRRDPPAPAAPGRRPIPRRPPSSRRPGPTISPCGRPRRGITGPSSRRRSSAADRWAIRPSRPWPRSSSRRAMPGTWAGGRGTSRRRLRACRPAAATFSARRRSSSRGGPRSVADRRPGGRSPMILDEARGRRPAGCHDQEDNHPRRIARPARPGLNPLEDADFDRLVD